MVRSLVKEQQNDTKDSGEDSTSCDEKQTPSRREYTKRAARRSVKHNEDGNQLVVNPYNEDSCDELLETDEEADLLRIGDIPHVWYEEFKHTGFDAAGQKVFRSVSESQIDKLLASASADGDQSWRQIHDYKNNRIVTLSDLDIEVIRRIRSRAYPNISFNPENTFIEFDSSDKIHPVTGTLRSKASFLPSKAEAKKVIRLVKLIRSGRLRQQLKRQPEVFDIWGDSITDDNMSALRMQLTAPKLCLPTHSESYNPPSEYLMSPEERDDWEKTDVEDRVQNYMPEKYNSLRHVPVYDMNVIERFQRLLDLYLAPRGLKKKMNIDPDSLLPVLPKFSEPSPASIRIVYTPRENELKDSGVITAVSVQPTQGIWVAAGSSTGRVSIFDVLSSRLFVSLNLGDSIGAIRWHPFLPLLAVASGRHVYIIVESVIDMSEVDEGAATKSTRVNDGSTLIKRGFFNSDSVLAAVNLVESGRNSHWKSFEDLLGEEDAILNGLAKQGRTKGIRIAHQSTVKHLDWHRKGNNLCAVSPGAQNIAEQCAIHAICKGVTVKPLRSSSSGRIQAASFHPSKPWLIVAYFKSVRVFDLQKRQQSDREHKTKGEGLIKQLLGCETTNCVAVDPSGNHVLVGGDNRRLVWYDMDLNNRPFKVLRCHDAAIVDIGLHPRRQLMFTSASDGSARMFHTKIFSDFLHSPVILPLKTLQIAEGRQQLPIKCAWHPSQPWLFSTAENGNLYMWA